MNGFNLVKHTFGESWAHDTLPIWVVEYHETMDRAKFFQGYIAIESAIPGRHPCMGGVNNRRIGSERGFKTIDEAMQAAIAKATQ